MTMYKDSMRDKYVEEYWYKKLAEGDYGKVVFGRTGRGAGVAADAVLVAGAGVSERCVVLSDRAIENVNRLAKGNESGKYVIFLALYSFVVYKYFRVKKLLVYSPATGMAVDFFPREAPFFLKLVVDGEISMKQWIVRVSEEVQGCAAHGDYDFGAMEARFADRKIDRDAVESLAFYYVPGGRGRIDTGKAKLLLGIGEDEQGRLVVRLRSRAGLPGEALEDDLVQRYHTLLNELPGLLEQRLKDWEWLTADERRTILFPGGRLEGRSEESLEGRGARDIPVRLLEAQVERTPDRIALQYGRESYTYLALNRESNRLAHYLREQAGISGDSGGSGGSGGFRSSGSFGGDIVVVLLDRSLYTGVGIWGVLKAGGILLYADPESAGIGELLKDVQPTCIVTEMRYLEKLVDYEGNVFVMDVQLAGLETSDLNPEPVNVPEDAAAVVYTTNGKGVLITHEAIWRLALDIGDAAGMAAWLGQFFGTKRMPAGMRALVVDEDLRLVPAGVGGKVVALCPGCVGYLNDPEATAATFISSPFPEWEGRVWLMDATVLLRQGSGGEEDAGEDNAGEDHAGERNAGEKNAGERKNSEEKIVPPRNSMEELLLGIWQKTLRNPRITIFSDFFLEGGDSIKAIQISSQLYGSGYKMMIRDIFQYPTVAQLAPRIVALEKATDQAPVTGEVPITPIQRWFLSYHRNAPRHFNQSVLLRFDEILDKQKVIAVFSKLQEHHDALRMTYRQNEQGDWIQYNNEPEFPLSLRVFDLRTTDDPMSVLARKSEEIQAGIRLDSGPLMKLGLFHLDDGSRLLIVIHHLVVDAVSFRILLEDIALLLTQYDEGVAAHLPVKTDSYKTWAQTLAAYAGDAKLMRERDYWEKQRDNLALLKAGRRGEAGRGGEAGGGSEAGMASGRCCKKDTRFLSFELSRAETSRLTGEANRAFHTEIQDLLIAAFLLASRDTWKQEKLTLMLEGHGRESVNGDLNVSRTVGWFTSLYPVQFDILAARDPADQIIMVKELIRKVPSGGIGYGIMGYLDRLPSVIFNYLGQFGGGGVEGSGENGEEGVVRLSDEEHGHSHSAETEILFDLEVTGLISDGQLKIGITFPEGVFAAGEAAAFLDVWQDHLLEITKYCSGKTRTRYTPSDFTYKGLGIEQVDAICQEYEVEDIYTLSPMQEGILFTCLYKEHSTFYFEQLSYRMRDRDLDPGRVRESIKQVMNRHAVLRTMFRYESLERPVQVVLQEAKEDFYFEDLRGHEAQEEYIGQYKQKDTLRPFNLKSGMLLRVAVFRLNEEEFEFIWSHHHMLMDAWCEGVLIREYYSIYDRLSGRPASDLLPVHPYRTYIQWLEARDKELSREYWRNYLSSYAKPAVLPKKDSRPAGISGFRTSVTMVIESEVTSMLQQMAATYQLTMNTLIQAAWGLVLAKYNNTTDVVFGSVVSGRPAEIPNVDSIVGLFINTIPVRVRFDRDTTFIALAGRLQQDALAGAPYHYENLAEIQPLSGLQQHIINHILLFDNLPTPEEQLHRTGEEEGVEMPDIYGVEDFEAPDYDMNIRVGAVKDIVIRFDYNGLAFDEFVPRQILSVFGTVLRTVAADPDCPVSTMEMVAPEALRRLKEFSTGVHTDMAPGSILPGFDEQAEIHYNETAIEFQDTRLTYGQLRERSEFLAQYLISRYGVKPGEIIAILMNRSELPLIAVMGILKAGAAFLPIETDLPNDRKAFILADAAVRLVLTESEFVLELDAYYHHRRLAMDLLEYGVGSKPELRVADPSGLAYVIYTSGSTGAPKGVCVEMRSLANYIYWANDHYFNNEQAYSFGLFTSMSFDLTITSLFSGLLRGGKLVVVPSEMDINDLFLYVFGNQTGINTVKITPSHVRLLGNLPIRKTSVGTVILGGEKVTAEQFGTLRRLNPAMRIFDEYGPTEATVGCTIKEIQAADETGNIGTPIRNTEVYILDAEGNFQPPGIPGEIYIGGACLSRGYLNRPELTAGRFQPGRAADGRMLYRTGDQAMWTTDGEIEFLGRVDEQVKIRGHRIEPAEIEQCLVQLPGITAAVVIARENEEKITELVGYYSGDELVTPSDIRRELAERLPEFMIPHHLLYLESFPLTTNGKVDKVALPFHQEGGDEAIDAPPSNSMEEQLCVAWKELLGLDKIGVNDNFFTIGGNSLMIIRLYDLIEKEFAEDIKVSDLYDNPTIARQAAIIMLLTGNKAAANEKVDLIDF